MYAKYKKDLTDKTSLEPSGHGQAGPCHRNDVSDDVKKVVTDCWVEVGRQMKQHDELRPQPVTHNLPAPGGWKSVHLFVSSTFTDFFSEREILVKKVFPELREWCSERRVKLIEVDLRWGIPSDSTSGETIAICLEELDNCHASSEGEPFFLNMLGERYGWMPDKNVVPLEVQKKYSWILGSSITFMEIMHGALRSRNRNAVFFFRDPSFLSDLPDEYHPKFEDVDSLCREHLRVLKSKLKEIFPANTFDYTATYGGIDASTGRNMVQITDLDDFANKCLAFFKTAIEKKYPDQQDITNYKETDQEKELQTIFITQKADLVIGRDDDIQVLMNYITGADSDKLDKIAKAETTIREKGQAWELCDDDNLVCVVEGRSGWGKTSLLSRFVIETNTKMPDLFFHFCGSTARSYSEHELLKSMIEFLSPDLSDDELKLLKGSTEEQIDLLNTVLVRFRQCERNAIIVVDAVNELNTKNSISHLAWLPPSIPKNLRMVVSCNEHAVTLARLREHPAYWFKLAPLSPESLKNIAIKYLGNFKKKLDEQQLSCLMTRSQVDGPLWMTLMCEELRVFGDFRTINKKIEEMPDSLDGLFGVILLRLQAEDDTGCIKKALCSMASSEAGILSSDILKVLGDTEKKEFAPALHWAQARRHLKPYIRVTGFPEEYVTFYHEAIWKAVRKNLLSTPEEDRTWQRHLANYYQYWCDKPYMKANYLPLHLKRAGENERLIEYLRNDANSMMMAPFQRSRYFQDLRCFRLADKVMSMTQDVKICWMCCKRMRAFNPGNMNLAEHSCVICAAHCFSFGNRQTGRICSFHAMKFRNSCFLCNHYIFPNDTKAIAGKLCNGCAFGVNGKKCVMINVN
ncbi:TPR repeat-containing protein DDB_G0287407-like [Gigantopelta aegis]|uniref:TPR repeat-containing protein DDB_G0287407-like n=1 Tax=Gigantopelta aegis TaxID=1735272 RepID=UPI001B8897EF|nr:TPR repeat-containing protein DDB_G0287407-like [Gigantopelta aegis]